MKDAPLLNLALAIFIMISIGWLLVVGRAIILPIVTAIIVVYVLVSASSALHRQPYLRRVPLPVIKLALAVVFGIASIMIAALAAATVREIATVAPTYEANIDTFLESMAAKYELDRQALWSELRAVTIEAFDLHVILLGVLGGFTNVGATVFLIVIYTAFFLSERSGFEGKIIAASSSEKQAKKAINLIGEMNSKISDYLAAKTLINIVLGAISFAVLWAHGVDFALFWAVMIGLLNYIPYVGSYLGVIFPVVLSFAQFVSLPATASLAVFLTMTQFAVGNIVEPRFIGRHVNLSPVVVLVALSVWTALWGIPGAILAVPMTSVLAIIFASFETTRFLSVLLSDQVSTKVE